MGFLSKLFGKGNAPSGNKDAPSGQQFKAWFKHEAQAKKYVGDEIQLSVLLAMQVSPAESVAICHAVAKGKYKIVPGVNRGDQGFDLIVFY